MFGIDGSEFLVIILVAVVVIGPKDMPKMLRAFARGIARVRAMAQEFKGQFDDAMRQADMQDTIDDLREMSDTVKGLDPRRKLREFYASLEQETDLERQQREEAEKFGQSKAENKAQDKPITKHKKETAKVISIPEAEPVGEIAVWAENNKFTEKSPSKNSTDIDGKKTLTPVLSDTIDSSLSSNVANPTNTKIIVDEIPTNASSINENNKEDTKPHDTAIEKGGR